MQEDVGKIISVLDTIPDEALTEEQRKIKEKYFHRFKYQDEQVDHNTNDTILISLLQVYHTYWRKTLLDKRNKEQYDKELKDSVMAFLRSHNYKPSSVSQPDIASNFGQHLKDFLKQQNYYAATGKTGGLFDLFIWPKEDTTTYQVKLPETEVKATIIFIDSTVTMGWQEYATFGKYYAGGWATKEFHYSVRKAYDTNSENFKVSYLTHEAQHFADYKTYPLLTGADLEYRAKLTELVFARETLYNLIQTFIRNANKEGRNSHAFANYAVIRDLSCEIFKKNFVSDIEQWKKVSSSKISKSSERLLKQHSKALKKAGPDAVTELIN
ncbi:hypothetical protein [uncultured Pontibacter sp.]|uniref:hypothetical protein n=1 Tax=uncultured Pontibacter sp. TaxID=453356 RepID=UPI0026348B28|nr:hypothetical protein [uncultured Pontibacter sp.]